MATIPLRTKAGALVAEAIVDACDYDDLAPYTWKLHSTGYVTRRLRGGTTAYAIHRQLMGINPGDPQQIDHINGDRLDNRRSNLRITTQAINARNLRSRQGGTSIYRGVSIDCGTSRWRADCKLDGHQYRLGLFNTELEAGIAAERWRRKHMPESRHDVELVMAAELAGIEL